MAQGMEEAQTAPLLRGVTPQDAADLVHLAQAAAGTTWTKAFVDWKYFHNPAGCVHGYSAEMHTKIVGFYGFLPLRIKAGQRVLLGAQAVDAMTAPAARRQGLFVRLGERAHAGAAGAGVGLAYAIANPISQAGSVKRLGWDDAGQIPRWVRVLDPTAVVQASSLTGAKARAYGLALWAVRSVALRRLAPPPSDTSVREVHAVDTRFDGLWKQASADLPIAIVRDRTYLTWRYVENPLVRHTILVAERGDELRGYLVLSHRDLPKGILAVAEFLVAPGDEPAGLALLSAAGARARELHTAQLQCWMLPQHRFYTRLLRRSGFLFSRSRCLPGLFRYTTSLIVKPTGTDALSPDPRLLSNWYMTMGDQDYY